MSSPIVDTVEGKLQGSTRKNFDGEEFYCFFGVPYAKPPLGDLRFKAPEPLEPWTGIRDATNEETKIYQRDSIMTLTLKVSGTEDGLHLNVFTKKPIPQGPKLNPVMVWIHGGAFTEGSNNTDIYGPEFLMMEDVVLVSMNYRLGLLGFIQFSDPSLEIFGNAGFKDQIEALKWIQRNIKNFGGDPNNVTIFGESAGAMSVQSLVLSPASKGLFHKAILQSGVLGSVSYSISYFAEGLLEFLGQNGSSEKKALEYLRSLSVEELFELQEKFLKGSKILISPVIEKPNSKAVFTKNVREHLANGDYNKVPIMIGYCSDEFMFMKCNFSENTGVNVKDMFEPSNVVSEILNVEKDDPVCKKLCEKVNDIYGNEDKENLQFGGDRFIVSIIKCAEKLAETSDEPVYLYRMSLSAGLNFMKILGKLNGTGASHLDDVGYLFNTTLPLPNKGSPEEGYVRIFVKLWTNFAKYGNPTPNKDLGILWEPIVDSKKYFMDIGEKLVLDTNPDDEKVKLWNEIYQANPVSAKFL